MSPTIKLSLTIVVTCYLHLIINNYPLINASDMMSGANYYPYESNQWHLDYYPYGARESNGRLLTESEQNDNFIDYNAGFNAGGGGRNKRGDETFSTDGGGKSISNIRKPLLFKRATTNVRKPLLFKRFIADFNKIDYSNNHKLFDKITGDNDKDDVDVHDEQFFQHLFSNTNNRLAY